MGGQQILEIEETGDINGMGFIPVSNNDIHKYKYINIK